MQVKIDNMQVALRAPFDNQPAIADAHCRSPEWPRIPMCPRLDMSSVYYVSIARVLGPHYN